ERAVSYRAGLAAALDAGYAILEHGGTSLDAVTAAVRIMEDDPQFNAGRGAVLNREGDAELDAAVMDGHGTRAGAVAAVRHDKHRGRVGDSPIIGAGTYADESCAVSGTGQGEFFILQVVAYDLCALLEYRHLTVGAAVQEVIHEKLRRTGGEGGVIALDRNGN